MRPCGNRCPAPASLLAVAALAFAAACTPPPPPAPHALDLRGGFRDVRFGQAPNQIPGLDLNKPISRDPASPDHLVCKRTNDDLRIRDLTLKEIRYAFFRNQLTEINLLWEPRSGNDPATQPAMYHFLTNEFGAASSEGRDAARNEFRAVWEGAAVRLTLVESPPQDRIAGRGLATFVSKPLAAQRDAASAKSAGQRRYGF